MVGKSERFCEVDYALMYGRKIRYTPLRLYVVVKSQIANI
jgi:hypothetical protein